MARRSQMLLPVRRYVVTMDGFGDMEVQAATAGAARYRYFKSGREAGYFAGGFQDFIDRGGARAREVRRPVMSESQGG